MLCYRCGVEIRDEEYVDHVVRCPLVTEVLCPVCRKRVPMGTVLTHIIEYHLGLTTTCPLCRKRFRKTREVLPHLREHFVLEQREGGVSKYICTLCGRVFTTKRAALVHVLKFHEKEE